MPLTIYKLDADKTAATFPVSTPSTTSAPWSGGTSAPRKRGRPPGSKNKPKGALLSPPAAACAPRSGEMTAASRVEWEPKPAKTVVFKAGHLIDLHIYKRGTDGEKVIAMQFPTPTDRNAWIFYTMDGWKRGESDYELHGDGTLLDVEGLPVDWSISDLTDTGKTV